MQPLSYFLAALIAFTGIIAGVFLAFFTKEEMKPGKRYFELLQKALLAVIAAVFLYYSGMQLVFRIAAYSVVILFLALSKNPGNGIAGSIIYGILGLVLYLGRLNQKSFFIISSLIFLYGLPTGSLNASGMLKKQKLDAVKKALVTGAGFAVVAVLIGVVF